MTTGRKWTHIVKITDLEASETVTTWLRAENQRIYWILRIWKLAKGWLRDYGLFWRVYAQILNLVEKWLHDYGPKMNAYSEYYGFGS